MPSKYLFLSNANIASISEGKVLWNNLPTLSESTRECYVSIYDMSVQVVTASNESPILVKINLPSINYFSSDNRSPTMISLPFTSVGETFGSNSGSPSIELLTNDNLKSIEVELVDLDNVPLSLTILSINLTLKIDYVDQKAIAQDYLSQIPMRLPS